MSASGIEKKLDRVLAAVQKLSDKMEKVEARLCNFETRLEQIEDKFESKIKNLEAAVNDRVTKEELNAVLKKLAQLEEKAKTEEKDTIMRESHSKRLNLLIHDVNESSDVWETREATTTLLDQFISDGLKLNPTSLFFVDFHRLPQKPVFKNGKKTTRPIIVKFGSVFDKKRVMDSMVNLKKYNADRHHNDPNNRSVYVTDHLPKSFYLQKKALMPVFKEARRLGQSTKWAIEDGDYCLYANNVKISMKNT